MTDLEPTTALGHTDPKHCQIGDLTLQEDEGLVLASLAIGPGQTVPQPFGVTLPDVEKISCSNDVLMFWIGPNKWMVARESKPQNDLAAELKSTLPGYAVTVQTDGFVVIHVTGPKNLLQELLTKLVNIDRDALAPGCAVRTSLDHMTVFLLRKDEKTLTLLGMRSFASSLWHALTTACERL